MAIFDGASWIVYDTANSGLPNNYVQSIVCDPSNGLHWVGTKNGLVSYDGINWVLYDLSSSGLPSNIVEEIAIDEGETKWIGTWEGLTSYDEINWVTYNPTNSGLPAQYVRTAIEDNGSKWIGTDDGLAMFDGMNWIAYNTSNSGLPNQYVNNISVVRMPQTSLGQMVDLLILMVQAGWCITLQIQDCQVVILCLWPLKKTGYTG